MASEGAELDLYADDIGDEFAQVCPPLSHDDFILMFFFLFVGK